MASIHTAALRGDVGALTRLLQEDPDLLDYLPLALPASRGHLEVIRHLLDAGAQVNEATPRLQDTALCTGPPATTTWRWPGF